MIAHHLGTVRKAKLLVFTSLASCFLSLACLGQETTQGVGQVITWDGSTGVAINPLVGAERFYDAGVWGQSTLTANVEAGRIWTGHEITSTVTNSYTGTGATGEYDWHATAVGSVLAGYDPSVTSSYPYYKLGMAPLTQLSSGAIATAWSADGSFEITTASFYSAYHHYFTSTGTHSVNLGGGLSYSFTAPIDVINSSWGFTDPAAQAAETMAIGGLARANPLATLVVSAGNSTNATNVSNNVGGPASSPNVISVGASGDGSINGFDTIASFSSRGPQDYFDPVRGLVAGVRAPVDLVAPGTSLAVAYYGGQTGGNSPAVEGSTPDPSSGASDWYSTGVAGTSFSAPIVAGGVSLLKSLSYLGGMGEESRDTRVIKSVLMNSATKLAGWDNGQLLGEDGVTVTTQSVDWTQGAGALNLDQAFDQFYSGTADVAGTGGGVIAKTGWDLGVISITSGTGQGSGNDYIIPFTLEATAVMDVTLSWFRNLAAPIFTDNTDPVLQSLETADLGFANLNLELWNSDFTKLFATSSSQYNSVEQLHFFLPETGLYGIRVTYEGQMYGSPAPETYGLAWNVEEVPEPSTVSFLVLSCLSGLVIARKKRPAA